MTQNNQEANPIIDESDSDPTIVPENYDITSFGADYDVEGCVKRLSRGDIFIPPFQRDYVWNLKDASRFIESLLFGLPVPGVFLAKEQDTNKLLVIDGQQRLKTLQYFFTGVFNPKKDEKKQRVFKLTGVQKQYEGKTFEDLEERDRVTLNDSIIHATIIKQESPEGNDTSIYHVFERLNSGGRKLAAQEIRSALYHGTLIDLVSELNNNDSWRKIFGKPHQRLKDVELIIRFFAIYKYAENYKRPMNDFLNRFTAKYRNPDEKTTQYFRKTFVDAIDVMFSIIGKSSFKLEKGVNAAVFDSVMYGVSQRLSNGIIKNNEEFKKAYDALLSDDTYRKSVSQATADETSVALRTKLAEQYFSRIV